VSDYRPLVVAYDVNPNSNYMAWAAAEYEAEAMAEEDVSDWAWTSAMHAQLAAWNNMIDRVPHD
jgi:hypothetical protein